MEVELYHAKARLRKLQGWSDDDGVYLGELRRMETYLSILRAAIAGDEGAMKRYHALRELFAELAVAEQARAEATKAYNEARKRLVDCEGAVRAVHDKFAAEGFRGFGWMWTR